MLTCRIISIPWCDQVVKIGDLKFGLVHGHTVIPWGDISSLGMIQRQLDVDILISGHTHEFRTYAYEDKLLVNPGSATGAYSSKEPSTTPSFCLFDVDASKVSEPATRRKTGRPRVAKNSHRGATERVALVALVLCEPLTFAVPPPPFSSFPGHNLHVQAEGRGGEEGEDVLREERVKERSPITNLGAGVGVRRIPVADFNALLVFELGARGTGCEAAGTQAM